MNMLDKENYDLRIKNNELTFEKKLTIQMVREKFHGFFSLNGYQRFYNRKSLVFRAGDFSHKGYVVESGRVRTYKLTPEGKEITFIS